MNFRIAIFSSFFAMISFSASSALSDELRAVIEDGRKVILSSDFKWKFDTSKPTITPQTIQQGMMTFQPQAKKFSVTYDSSKWSPESAKESELNPGKKVFKHKLSPVYAVIISDELPLSNDSLRNIILSNAKSTGSEPKILMENNIQVNGNAISSIRFTVSTQGIDFLFWTKYFANEDGNIQLACYTGQSLFFKYEADCQQFHDGLKIK